MPTRLPRIRISLRALPFVSAALISLGASAAPAKSPEDFVGPAPSPATDSSAAPTTKGRAPAGKPAAKTSAVSSAPANAAAPAGAPATGKTAARSASKASAKNAIDTAKVHAVYLDGDFDTAIRTLEGALKSKKPLTHADSVFAFKHLGVMYAATPATREKGRYYMLQLMYIEPTAKILDMYASDMIYMIFRNVQEEFENQRAKMARNAAPIVDTTPAPDTTAKAPPPPAAPVARESSSRSRTLYWVTGGVALAAGTAGLLFVVLDNPKPKKHSIVVQE